MSSKNATGTQVDQNREDDGQLAHQATPKVVGHEADNRSVWQYVAMFETGVKGGNYFKFAYLDVENGLIAPPTIDIHGVTYAYAPDQWHIAKLFNTSQQNVSRWLRNEYTGNDLVTKSEGLK